MTANTITIVQTTVAGRRDALRLAGLIVRERLAACVQIMPIHSTYRWRNKLERSAEWLLTAKTRNALAGKLMAFIRHRHKYELPEIIAFSATRVLPAYRRWVFRETKAGKSARSSIPPK